MPKPKDSLDRINTITPCTANWDEMVGNDDVRFCRHCDLSVYNLSAMTRKDAMRIVIESKGKLCARYIRRPDGAIHTTDLIFPRLHSITRRASRLAAGAFGAALSFSTSVVAAAPATTNSTTMTSRSISVANNIVPTSQDSIVKGVVMDANGAVIPGATVSLLNNEGNIERTASTDDTGTFKLPNVAVGSYSVRIESSGFETKEIANLVWRVHDEQSILVVLEVAKETVVLGGSIFVAPSDPLVAAAAIGDVAEVKNLLASGSDVNVVDSGYDSTPLAQAVMNGNFEVVQVLLNAGADTNLTNKTGQTALMGIGSSTTSETVRALINAGAKTEIRDEYGSTALLFVAGYADPDALKALLDGGAVVDARDEEERTPLMIAARAGNAPNVSVLLKAGATVNLRDTYGTTALGLAMQNDLKETIKVLLSFGAKE